MNLLNFLNIKASSNFEILKAATVKNKLDEFLSSQMNEMGLVNWNKNYQWSSDFNEFGVKHVLEYISGKGISGTFQWGNVFNFIPESRNSKKNLNNKMQLQLFERTQGWHESFETELRSEKYSVSHWNEYFFNKSLPLIFKSEKERITDWFISNKNVEQNIETALRQIRKGGAYEINSPNQKFILAFLYAKNGDLNLAENTLYQYYNPLIKLDDEVKSEFENMEKQLNEMK